MIIHAPLLTREIMGIVLIALVPMCGTALYFFGLQGGLLILSALAGAIAAELLTDLITRRFHCMADGTAAVTGIITGLLMPPGVPLWMPAAAAAAPVARVSENNEPGSRKCTCTSRNPLNRKYRSVFIGNARCAKPLTPAASSPPFRTADACRGTTRP